MSDSVPATTEEVERLTADGVGRIAEAPDLDALAALDTEHLGKRSRLSAIKASMRDHRVSQRLNRVTTMLAHPSSLASPGFLLRALTAR